MTTEFTCDTFIPMSQWSKDHWSTFAYVEHVMVETAGFQIGFDGRMKSNRRNFRILKEDCPKPKRPSACSLGVVMDLKYSTVIKNGQQIHNHDDWHCVQDMAAEGLFTVTHFEPKDILHLSDKGQQIASQLRQHKASGGSFKDFAPTVISN